MNTMTYGLYAGISDRDRGNEPPESVCNCPECGGEVYRRNNPPRGLICSECLRVYNDMADIAKAEAYYLALWGEMNGDDQRDEDGSGYADAVAEGLERWTR